MIRYACPQCGAKLESPDSLGGELDKCPACGYECAVPRPKPPRRRAFMVIAGGAGVLAGAVLAVVITIALTSGTGPSPLQPKGNPDPKTTAKAIAKPPTTAPAWQSAPIVNAQSAAPTPLSPEQLFEQASPAVVYIVVRDKDFKPIGLGSGFFVAASGLIVTNYHLIKGAEFATARVSSGATLFIDGVVATNPDGDLALLKVSGGGFPCLQIAKGGLPKIGAAVYAIGNPRGLENTFSGGMVSGHREIKPGLTTIQVTTPISPGSSGGPLLNANGEVVGVTTAYLTTGQNLNFAAPVSDVSALMRTQGKVRTLASAGGHRLDTAETGELNKAWAAMDKRDWGTAAKILKSLSEQQRENPFVWYALGHLRNKLGNYEIAIQHYMTAIALKPDYAEAYSGIGDAYEFLDRYAEAIEAYKKAVVIEPGDGGVYFGMGTTYQYKLKRYPEAIAAYKKAAVINPVAWGRGAYSGIGDAYRKLERYPEAIAAYEKAVEFKQGDFNTDTSDLYIDIGDAYYELKRYDEATKAYGWVLANTYSTLLLVNAIAYRRIGDAYYELKRYAEAIDAYKKSIVVEPNDGRAYCGLGSVYEALKRYPEAIAAYEKAVAVYEKSLVKYPDDPLTHYGMGEAYRALKRYPEAIAAYKEAAGGYRSEEYYPEAIEAYKKAIAIKPDDASAYVHMGYVYEDMNRYPEAIEAYKKSVAIKSDYAEAYIGMGDAYCGQKRYPDALDAYNKAVAIDPKDHWAYIRMGLACHELKRYAEALDAYKKSVVIKPDYAYAYLHIGDAYYELNRYAEALAAYEKTISIEPIDKRAYRGMGDAYCELKRYPEAIAAYEQFLRLAPTDSKADYVRKRLPELRRLAGK